MTGEREVKKWVETFWDWEWPLITCSRELIIQFQNLLVTVQAIRRRRSS